MLWQHEISIMTNLINFRSNFGLHNTSSSGIYLDGLGFNEKNVLQEKKFYVLVVIWIFNLLFIYTPSIRLFHIVSLMLEIIGLKCMYLLFT